SARRMRTGRSDQVGDARPPSRARAPHQDLAPREVTGAEPRHGALSATLLLDASVIDDPYAFYRRLVAEAPVWCVPDTEIVIVSPYDGVTEVVSRVDDFPSTLHALLSRSALGPPALLPFESGGVQTLAIAAPPVHARHRGTVFPELVARR